MPDTHVNLIEWDKNGERFFENGVRNCVLYLLNSSNGLYDSGYAWNGITAINERPSGAEPTALYADDIKYLNIISAEDFAATIEAYTYPKEFMQCDGSATLAPGLYASQQPRKTFGLCYRTTIGNDENTAAGYKLHFVYGCRAAVSERNYATINDSPEAITFSWEISTTPVNIGGDYKPTAHLTVSSLEADATKLAALEAILYGTAASGNDAAVPAVLPLPATIIDMLD